MTYPYRSRVGTHQIEFMPGRFIEVAVSQFQCPMCQEWKLREFGFSNLFECRWCGEEFDRRFYELGSFLERLP